MHWVFGLTASFVGVIGRVLFTTALSYITPTQVPKSVAVDEGRPHICHGYHRIYLWRKFCHVEKFQISVKNLNNLWHFIDIYAVFVLNLCGEKSVWKKMTNMKVGRTGLWDERFLAFFGSLLLNKVVAEQCKYFLATRSGFLNSWDRKTRTNRIVITIQLKKPFKCQWQRFSELSRLWSLWCLL